MFEQRKRWLEELHDHVDHKESVTSTTGHMNLVTGLLRSRPFAFRLDELVLDLPTRDNVNDVLVDDGLDLRPTPSRCCGSTWKPPIWQR